MNPLEVIPKLTTEALRDAVKKEYSNVALDPHKGYHFHTGRDAIERLGYDESLYAELPEGNVSSFAGTGNPFMLGPINAGEVMDYIT